MERSSQGLSSEKGLVDLRFDIHYQNSSNKVNVNEAVNNENNF